MLTKTLKILEQRSLIKSIRSVVSKSKKLYVLFDVVPAKSVTGGPWYSDQEFDHEFVSELSNFIVHAISSKVSVQAMDLSAIVQCVVDSHAFTVRIILSAYEPVIFVFVHNLTLRFAP